MYFIGGAAFSTTPPFLLTYYLWISLELSFSDDVSF